MRHTIEAELARQIEMAERNRLMAEAEALHKDRVYKIQLDRREEESKHVVEIGKIQAELERQRAKVELAEEVAKKMAKEAEAAKQAVQAEAERVEQSFRLSQIQHRSELERLKQEFKRLSEAEQVHAKAELAEEVTRRQAAEAELPRQVERAHRLEMNLKRKVLRLEAEIERLSYDSYSSSSYDE